MENGVGRQAPTWPEAARDRSWQRQDASSAWSRQSEAGKAGVQASPEQGQHRPDALKTSATSQWGSQITELDGAVEALKTTIAGISGDSLLSDLPTIVSDLQRIDTAW